MRVKRWIDPNLAVELLLLALAAPALYFPGWFPAWAPYAAFGALVAGWAWRRWRLGIWYAPTPADWPIFFLFGVMLPVAVWAAPGPLREQYSIPRAYILLWNFCLFWTVVTHASRSRQSAEWALGGFALSALGIALVAPLGMNWLYKFPGAEQALSAIPSPLLGVFQGAESGFHPNQVAGTLLYAFPLLFAITAADAIHRRRTLASRLVTWLVWVSTPVVGLALLLTQSRSALLGLIAGLAVMALLPWRRGRWALVVGVAALLAAAPFAPPGLVDAIGDSPPVEALGGTSTLGFREDVWTQAIGHPGLPVYGDGAEHVSRGRVPALPDWRQSHVQSGACPQFLPADGAGFRRAGPNCSARHLHNGCGRVVLAGDATRGRRKSGGLGRAARLGARPDRCAGCADGLQPTGRCDHGGQDEFHVVVDVRVDLCTGELGDTLSI